MTIPILASQGRPALLDRLARWALDADGDHYGDERERLRWYEGIAIAASLQWLAVPWAATVLVWVLGRPAVLPLGVVMASMYLPIMVCATYMRRRRVETAVRRWSRKAVVLSALGGLPYAFFIIGCLRAYSRPDSSTVSGMLVGAVVGGVLAVVLLVVDARRRRRRDAVAEDQD